MMKKVILNKCYGGFNPSSTAYLKYAEKKNIELFKYNYEVIVNNKSSLGDDIKLFKSSSTNHQRGNMWTLWLTKDFGDSVTVSWSDIVSYSLKLNDDMREDATFIEVVEELKDEASDCASHLVVVEIPDDLDYVIDDYDGYEKLHQRVQEW